MDVRAIRFAREKYGVPLAVDVADVRDLPGFIQTDEPHALSFYELMFVTGGRGSLDLDATSVEVAPSVTLVTRPGQARRWRMRAPLRAIALFFEREFVDGLFDDPSFLDERGMDAHVRMEDTGFRRCLASLSLLTDEMRRLRPDSAHVVRAGLHQLLVWMRRAAQHGATTRAPAAPRGPLARDLRRLVERHYREQQRVGDYARMLGVSAEHLSRAVRRETGTTARDVIHQRVLLEAKRMLRYSERSVAAIGEELDFADASHFVRFFKNAVGTTPAAFRRSHFRS